MIGPAKVIALIDEATATGAGQSRPPWSAKKSFQAIGSTSAGVGAATIGVEVSNDGTNFVEIDELTLTLGTTVTSDTYVSDTAWKYVRGNVKTISGTDATVSLFMGVQ